MTHGYITAHEHMERLYDLHVLPQIKYKRLTMGALALHRPEGRELESLQLNFGQVHQYYSSSSPNGTKQPAVQSSNLGSMACMAPRLGISYQQKNQALVRSMQTAS
jgi:hypothetical protein